MPPTLYFLIWSISPSSFISVGEIKYTTLSSSDFKTKPIAIRFLKNTDEILCADLEKYGPFKAEDIATLPNENAQELISNNIAIKIRIDE